MSEEDRRRGEAFLWGMELNINLGAIRSICEDIGKILNERDALKARLEKVEKAGWALLEEYDSGTDITDQIEALRDALKEEGHEGGSEDPEGHQWIRPGANELG